MAKTRSEKLFEEYLSNKGLVEDHDFFYEPPHLGGPKRPDYLVHVNGGILFEIKEFGNTSNDRRLREHPGRVITLNSYSHIRGKIQAARKKFISLKGKYPCILVLHQGNSFTSNLDDSTMVAAAAFGDLSVNYSSSRSQSQWFFGRNSELTPGKNKTLSAIAVIEEKFPERERAASEFWKEHGLKQLQDNLGEIHQKWADTKGYDLNQRVVRMRVILNPFADKPAPETFFNHSLDEIWSTNKQGQFGRTK